MTVTLELNPALAADLDAEAERLSETRTDLIVALVEKGLARRKRVDRLIEETLTENAELYRRLA